MQKGYMYSLNAPKYCTTFLGNVKGKGQTSSARGECSNELQLEGQMN